MAVKDQLLFGTYVGLVLDTQDPDSLGRVKLIVPGVTGPLFKGWNDNEKDISFTTVSSNPFTPEILDRLVGVLPWARPSTPFVGGGTGAPVNTDTQTSTVVPTEQSISGGATAGAAPATEATAAPSTPSKTPDNRSSYNDGVNNTQGDHGGPENKIGSPNDCASNPSGSAMSLERTRGVSKSLNDQMDANGQKIAVNNGVMNETSFKAYAKERLKCSPLLTAKIPPDDAATYHITDTTSTDQWADFMWRTALAERSGKVSAAGDPDSTNDPGGSWGAFSVSQNDTKVYGGYSGKSVNDIETNPEFSANVAISMVENEVCRNNTVSGLDHSVTLKGSFAHTTMEALAGKKGQLTAAKSGALVQRTTNLGQNAYGSANMSRYGAPIGNFSIPAAGSKVWVIFEHGSPQRPVYIGQVYEPSNIQAHN